jgi:hypothetical protein
MNLLNTDVYELQSNVSILQIETNIMNSNITEIHNGLTDLEENIHFLNLDRVVQGSKNKYIVDDIYNNSLLINGTLTVRDIQILDVNDDYYSDMYNSNLYDPGKNSNITYSVTTNISNIVIDILNTRDYDNRLNNIYTTLSYAFELETTLLSNRINGVAQEFLNTSNLQVNEIRILKNNMSNLEQRIIYLESLLPSLL